MAITISSEGYSELWQESNPELSLANGQTDDEFQQVIPKQLGQGHVRQIQLQGIHLCLCDYQLHDDLCVVDKSQSEASSEYEFGFHLSGNRAGKRTGENFLYWGIYEGDEDEWKWITYANEPVLKVDIHLESADGLAKMITEFLHGLPETIRRCLDAENNGWFSNISVITPAMRAALEQILHCPFQGKTKQIYLESKCLELIALKLEQLRETENFPRTLYSLKPDDIDRIYVAQKLLAENLYNPPSLMELARQVGLNDYKLKVGFREVFGTTVFGYLYRHRMETARQMLNDRRMNVREVAQAVGYTNQSRFAAAFRKQFGINPKAYVLSRKSG